MGEIDGWYRRHNLSRSCEETRCKMDTELASLRRNIYTILIVREMVSRIQISKEILESRKTVSWTQTIFRDLGKWKYDFRELGTRKLRFQSPLSGLSRVVLRVGNWDGAFDQLISWKEKRVARKIKARPGCWKSSKEGFLVFRNPGIQETGNRNEMFDLYNLMVASNKGLPAWSKEVEQWELQ